MPKPDEDKPHPTKTDHPGKGKGENPNPGNRPDRPEEEVPPVDPNAPYVDNTLPGDLPEDPPAPTELPA